MITSAPPRLPANTTAPAHTDTPASSTSGSGRGASVDAECGARRGGLPSTTWSWMWQPSPTTVPGWTTTNAPKLTPSPTVAPSPIARAAGPSGGADMRLRAPRRGQRVLEGLEHAHDPQAAFAVGARRRAVAHAGDEVLALRPQRLGVG